MEWTNGDYLLTDDATRLDLDAICRLLSDSYWANDRPRSVMAQAVKNSLCLGVFREDNQIGFARAVTDRATFAWICDVVIHADHRCKGLGKWMIECLLAHPQLENTTQVLRTKNAHAFYEQFGFERVEYLRRSPRPA